MKTSPHYPWHQRAWHYIEAYQRESRLPHALLISGIPGLAKKAFAEQLAQKLLCEKQAKNRLLANNCDCFSCRLPDLNGHPDYKEISPIEDSKSIKIEQIRDTIEMLWQTTHRAGMRVILIAPAEAMNISAMNALLKTLEEPPPATCFLLITHAWAQLPATIRSRCQSIKIHPAFDNETIQWVANQGSVEPVFAKNLLNQAEGSPQQALDLITSDINPLQIQLQNELLQLLKQPSQLLAIAQRWQKQGFAVVLDNLIWIINHTIKQQFYSSPEPIVLSSISLQELIQFARYLFELRKEFIMNPNLNPQLLSEKLLFQWININVARISAH